MSLYADILPVIEQTIREYGKPAELLRAATPESGGGWDPDGDAHEPPETPVRMVQQDARALNRDQSMIEAGDLFGAVSTEGVSTPPTKADKIRVDGVVYRFVWLDVVNPGGTNIVFKFHGRR